MYLVKVLNFSVILLNILDHVTQIYSKIVKSFTLSYPVNAMHEQMAAGAACLID